MANDVNDPNARDEELINVDQPQMLDNWSKELGVTPEVLKAAVIEVGPIVKEVRVYLASLKSSGV